MQWCVINGIWWRKWQFIHEETSTQVDVHSIYDRILFQLVVREHLHNFSFILEDLRHHVSLSKIKRIANIYESGLLRSLALEIVIVRSLWLILKCEIVSIHRLRGHIFPFIDHPLWDRDFREENFPHLLLFASVKHSFIGCKCRFYNTYLSTNGIRCNERNIW